jgi:hypothetical protein
VLVTFNEIAGTTRGVDGTEVLDSKSGGYKDEKVTPDDGT